VKIAAAKAEKKQHRIDAGLLSTLFPKVLGYMAGILEVCDPEVKAMTLF
jgi:hypothetical protein